MEVGEFPRVDWRLIEAKNILKNQGESLDEERARFYWGKYYHLQGKNTWRGHYYQRAYETFTDGIEFFEGKMKKGPVDRTTVKYLCKLHEGQAHLVCEVLLFDWAESHLDDAEALYEKHSSLFNRLDKFKFLVKKSSFLKKFGFFDEALDLLITLEKDVMSLLQESA
jgi:hypothetical protein